MGRRVALLLSAFLLLASGCDGDTPARGPAPGRPSSSASSVERFDPPAGQRWAGTRDVVVAVPEKWRSIENPFCQRPPTHTVVYFNPLNLAGSCPYMPTPSGPPPSYLQIEQSSTAAADRAHARRIMIGDLRAYAWNHRRWHSAGIRVPARHFAIFIITPHPGLARRIINSVAQVPDGFRVIPKPAYASRHLDDMMQRLRDHDLRPTYAEEGPGNTEYGYPGRFIRTDPPVGSVVGRGDRVTAYFSSGRLSAWITARRLATQGWSVAPPRSFTPPVTRNAALAKLGRNPNERAAFLRTLTIDGRTRQAWLVVDQPHYAYPGQAVSIAAVDARTGKLWRTPVPFTATR